MSFEDFLTSAKLKAESVKLDVEFAGLVAGGLVKDAVDSHKEKKNKKKQEIANRNKELYRSAVLYAKNNRSKILDKYLASEDYDWDEAIGVSLVRCKTGDVITDTHWPDYEVEVLTDASSFIVEIGFEGAFLVFYALKMIFPVVSCEYTNKQYHITAYNLGEKWYTTFKEAEYNVTNTSHEFVDYLVLESSNLETIDELQSVTSIARNCLRTNIKYWNKKANSICDAEEHKLATEIVDLFHKADENLSIIETKEAMEEKDKIDNESESAIREAGEKGENEVSYALKWLDNYEIFDKSRNNGKAIELKNLQYIDESQEYDHILVGNNGLIIIETKAYSGKIVIDKTGNWSREKDGEVKGIRNPLQQVRRHEKLLKSIIPDNIEVSSIICIAKDSAMIEGSENSVIPVVKCDQLVEYIESNNTVAKLSDQQVEECCKVIREHQVI